MGRRNLIRSAALAAIAFAVIAAPAGAAIGWRLLSDGPASGAPLRNPVGYVALSKSSALAQFGARLGAPAKTKLGTVDFSKRALVAILGEFGCQDSQVALTSIAQHSRTLAVSLTRQPPPPGTVECMAIFATYRLVTVPLPALTKPYPTRVAVTLAPA